MENFATEVENLDNVPSEFHVFYTEGDGKFTLNTDAITGAAVKGITGLNTALKKSRNDAKSAKGKAVDLSGLSDYGTNPEDIKTAIEAKLIELTDQLSSGDGKAKLDLEKIKAQFTAQNAKNMADGNTVNETLKKQLYNMLVVTDASSAIADLKGNSKLLMPLIQQMVKVQEEDGQQAVVVVDGDGSIRMNGATQLPMTVRQLVEEMKADTEFSPAFASEARAGTGATQHQRQHQQKQGDGKTAINSVGKIAAGLSKGLHKQSGTLR